MNDLPASVLSGGIDPVDPHAHHCGHVLMLMLLLLLLLLLLLNGDLLSLIAMNVDGK